MNPGLITAVGVGLAFLFVIGSAFWFSGVRMKVERPNISRLDMGTIIGIGVFVILGLLSVLGYMLRDQLFPPAP